MDGFNSRIDEINVGFANLHSNIGLAAFTYENGNTTWTVPTGVNKIWIYACGAGLRNEAGQYIAGREYAVTQGDILTVQVGSGNTVITSSNPSWQTITLTAGGITKGLNANILGVITGVNGEGSDYNSRGGNGGAFGFGGGGVRWTGYTEQAQGLSGGFAIDNLGGSLGGEIDMNGKDGLYSTALISNDFTNRILALLPDLRGYAGGSGGCYPYKNGGSGCEGKYAGGLSFSSTGGSGGGGAGGYGAGAGTSFEGSTGTTVGTPSRGMCLFMYIMP